jgi:mannonate dehydratase
MEQTWRWFGPEDAVPLRQISQAGATGIVTALHHIPYGEVWSVEEIETRKRLIAADPGLGLKWRVVESLPVADSIKLGSGADNQRIVDNYRQSIRNLAQCGIRTVCYNFMPVIDWTRTELAAPLPNGARTLRFEAEKCAAFDCFMLKRAGAEDDYLPEVMARAHAWLKRSSYAEQDRLINSIMVGLPGAFQRYDINGLRAVLDKFAGVTANDLRANLRTFLIKIAPVADEAGVRLAIHPDDPPWSLFGLPRGVSSASDLRYVVDSYPGVANGLTLCTGSLGAGPMNDLPAIAESFRERVCYAHLRNVAREPDGSFSEVPTLEGDVDIVMVVATLLREEQQRRNEGEQEWEIPFRPDHGLELLDDIGKPTHPGYPAIGRLRGLAELRGVIAGVQHMRATGFEGGNVR